MATLVQTTPATRHSSQSYPIVRPSSSSAQRPQPLYLLSSPPQMYIQQQQQQPFGNYDFTRQTYHAQQHAKHAQSQQQRRVPVRSQPSSAPPYPLQQQQGIQARSRSEGALREKSHAQSQIQSSVQAPSPLEAQSAPRPPSSAFRPPLPSLPTPPQVLGAPPRPSSADGTRPPTYTDNYRARVYPDQRSRHVPLPASPRDTTGRYLPPAVLGGYGHQPRYSAEDVSTLKNMGYQTVPQIQNSQQYPAQQFPIHSQYQNQAQYAGQHYKSRVASHQPAHHHTQPPSNSKPQLSPPATFALPQQPPQPFPTRSQPSPTRSQPSPTRPLPSPTRAHQSPPLSNVRPQSSPQPSYVKPQQSPQSPPSGPSPRLPLAIPPQITSATPQVQPRQSSLPRHIHPRESRGTNRTLSPPPHPQPIKRPSSSPELATSQSTPLHRKSSSSSSVTSAASAPSQLETASTHSSVPSSNSSVPSTQAEHSPFSPSPLSKLTEDDVPPVVKVDVPAITVVVETRRSLTSRLRRAFSFSGTSNITTSTSTPNLHASASTQTEEEIDQSDRISISSTASSASILIRNLSSGFRKSRKSIIGIFKGGRRRSQAANTEEENKFPFGIPGEEDTSSVGISYATAEGEISRETEDTRRKSTVFSERETIVIKVSSKKGRSSKSKTVEPTNIRGILKRIFGLCDVAYD